MKRVVCFMHNKESVTGDMPITDLMMIDMFLQNGRSIKPSVFL